MRGTLGPPMMRRLIEYSAIIIRMLASRSMILSLTLSQPVISPATAPAAVAASVATQALVPVEIRMAQTAPPSGKLPSTVRSGKRSSRNEMKTPRATRLKIRPISTAPSREKKDMGSGASKGKNKAGATRCMAPAGGAGHAPSPAARGAYCTTCAADLTSASDSFTPCFSAAPGFTNSSILVLISGLMSPGFSPLRMRATMRPVCSPRSR